MSHSLHKTLSPLAFLVLLIALSCACSETTTPAAATSTTPQNTSTGETGSPDVQEDITEPEDVEADTTPDTPPPLEDTTPDIPEPEDTAPLEDTTPDAPPPPEDTTPDVPDEPDAPCTPASAYPDLDNDGQGEPGSQEITFCVEQGLPPNTANNTLDCDDNDPDIYSGQRRCAPDGTGIEICGGGTFRPVESCGFEKECFRSPAGPRCGCIEGTQRCEQWYVRFCAPDRLEYTTHDCRPEDCSDAMCPGCTIRFAYPDNDRDGQGDLHAAFTYCTENGTPANTVTERSLATDCDDASPERGQGSTYCSPDNLKLLRCTDGWDAPVESCFNGCRTISATEAECL